MSITLHERVFSACVHVRVHAPASLTSNLLALLCSQAPTFLQSCLCVSDAALHKRVHERMWIPGARARACVRHGFSTPSTFLVLFPDSPVCPMKMLFIIDKTSPPFFLRQLVLLTFPEYSSVKSPAPLRSSFFHELRVCRRGLVANIHKFLWRCNKSQTCRV